MKGPPQKQKKAKRSVGLAENGETYCKAESKKDSLVAKGTDFANTFNWKVLVSANLKSSV